MSENQYLDNLKCQRCPIAQDIQDMIEDYTNLVSTQGKQDVRLWPDYHRGSQRARITLAKVIVKELAVALAGNGRLEQDREDL